jgi:rod shape-determining protein MreC
MTGDTRRSRIVLALLLLTSLALVTLDFRGGDAGVIGALRTAAATVFGPLETTASAATRSVRSTVADVRDTDNGSEDVSALQKQNDELRAQLRTSELARARVAELDALLRLSGAGQYRILPARVVAIGSAQDHEWTATIDAGSDDGLARNMTVVNGDGLVGRITAVGPATATVLLAIDPSSSVGSRMEASQQLGVTTGAGGAGLTVELLDPQAPLQAGDRLVTVGSQESRPFVSGVPVGEVVEVKQTPGALTKKASVRPYVTFSALDLVGVVVEPPREDPRDTLLPPRPAG